MKADTYVETKYIESEIKVTCMLCGIKENLEKKKAGIAKRHIRRNKKNRRNGSSCKIKKK